ncbi:MAG: diguanylate cyclase [Bacilli bacterium]|nr:diguanylate cyclase [Bacilli bacterium]
MLVAFIEKIGVIFPIGIIDAVCLINDIALIILSLLFLLGAIYALIASFKIKSLKNKHQDLQLYSNFIRTFAHTENSLVYLKDENLRYLFINPAVEDFYHLKADAIIGFDDAAISDEEFIGLKRKSDLSVLQDKKTVNCEIRWHNRFYETKKFPVVLPTGTVGVGAFITDITEQIINQKKLEQTSFRNEILLSAILRNYTSIQEQLDYVLNQTIKLTESEYGYVYLYNEEKEEFTLNSWSLGVLSDCELSKSINIRRLNEVGLWGEVIRQARPLIINDYPAYPRHKKGYPQGHVRLFNFMTIPIIIEGKILAVVGLANKPYGYDDTDINQVTILMNGIWHNIERRKRSIELETAISKLKANEARLELILNSTADAIFGVDREGKCTFCNQSCLRLLGYRNESDLIGQDMHKLLRYGPSRALYHDVNECKIRRTYNEGQEIHADDEMFFRANGSWFYVEYNSYPQYHDNEIVGAVVSFSDITKRKETEKKILFTSYQDSLTGLFNRRFLEIEIKKLDVKENLPLSIIMGDVNGLKLINDVFGHNTGDELLRKSAEVMKRCCRPGDVVARWGGDEFVVVLPATSYEDAEKIAEKIKSAFANEKIKELACSISLGFASKTKENQNIKSIIDTAEEQMYIEKSLNSRTFNYSSIVNILNVLFEKYPDIRRHSERVRDLAERLGRRLKFSKSEYQRLIDACFFHDIGKISLQDIKKQDEPNLKKHTVVGFRILNNSEDTVALAKYVLSHHERWDGTGYPKGLKGEAIPRISRVIGLVECYDAITMGTDDPLLKQKALTEIATKAGTQFDPAFTGEFIEMMKNDKD